MANLLIISKEPWNLE